MARFGDRRAFNRWPDFTEEQRREFGRRGAANQKPADKGFASVPGLASAAGKKGARVFWDRYRQMKALADARALVNKS